MFRAPERRGAARLEATEVVRRPLELRPDEVVRPVELFRPDVVFRADEVELFRPDVVVRLDEVFRADEVVRPDEVLRLDEERPDAAFLVPPDPLPPDERRFAEDRPDAARRARAARSRSDRVEVMVCPPPSPLPRRGGSVPAA